MALITAASNWKSFQGPPALERINISRCDRRMKCCPLVEGWTSFTCNNIDGFQKHYAEEEKPTTKDGTLSVSISAVFWKRQSRCDKCRSPSGRAEGQGVTGRGRLSGGRRYDDPSAHRGSSRDCQLVSSHRFVYLESVRRTLCKFTSMTVFLLLENDLFRVASLGSPSPIFSASVVTCT